MKKEKYERAIAIDIRLKELEDVKKLLLQRSLD